RGACCRLPERIALAPEDVARLRKLWSAEETTPGGLTLESAVAAQPDHGLTLAAGSGACVLLEPDGRCAAGLGGGRAAQPVACRSAPLVGALCEGALDAALALECACETTSLDAGEPLAAAAGALLDLARARGFIEEVAPEVARSTAARWSRGEYLAWRRAA